jgi:chromosome segregation ATPase
MDHWWVVWGLEGNECCLYLPPPASAEISDASETYQTNMVRLNEQLAGVSLQLSQARKSEAKLSAEGEIQADHAEELQASLKQARLENAALLSQVEALQGEAEQRDCATREAVMTQLKLEEEKGQWEEEREHWTSKVLLLERELAGARESVVEAERLCAVPAHCLAEPSSWEDEKASLVFKVQALQGESSQLASRAAELEREVEDARNDGHLELEILQTRISELTQENASMVTTCESLQAAVEKLRTQLSNDGKCGGIFGGYKCFCFTRVFQKQRGKKLKLGCRRNWSSWRKLRWPKNSRLLS